MNREIEIKLRVDNLSALLQRLRKLGAKHIESVHEENTLFDTSDHGLQRAQAILRIRRESPATAPGKPRTHWARARRSYEGLLTYKGPVAGNQGSEKYKIREEIEYHIKNTGRFERLFHRLGLRSWFRYEKYRTTYRLRGFPALHVDLDETPIGVFVELEGPKRTIGRAARVLGYAEKDYSAASYLELYRKECARRGVKPGEMVFKMKNNR